MRTIVTVIAVLGGLFLVQAVVWGALSARSRVRLLERYRALSSVLSQHNIHLVSPEHRGCQVDVNAAMAAVGADPNTGADIAAIRQLVEAAILRQVLRDLRGPAALGLAGVVLATTAAVWGLWL
jgi:hypothetical protein